MGQFLLTVDPSLTCSGWALFSLPSGELAGVGKIRGLPSEITLSVRLKTLQRNIEELLETLKLAENDVLVCEAPTTMRDPRAAIKVEQVRTIFESVARSRSICVPGRVNPRSVQTEIMGLRGKQLARRFVKEIAVQIVERLYSDSLSKIGFSADAAHLKRNQDIVDAILIGSLVTGWLRAAGRGGLTMESIFSQGRPRRSRRTVA